jgi:DNA-binding MarR family transcriptional regulator
MMQPDPITSDISGAPISGDDWPLQDRPGFLIRRVHQIHVSLFNEACAEFRVTPLQYSLLSALMDRQSADQTTLANLVALDRTTTTGALKRLELRGLIRRERSDRDRRAHVSALTDEGRALYAGMEASVRRAHADTVSVLNAEEAAAFIGMMRRITAAHEDRRDSDALADGG